MTIMDETEQSRLVTEANVVGLTMKRLSDSNRELEATNSTLQDALRRADEEIQRKDAIIANLTAQLDDVMRDSDLTHRALIDIHAKCRETLAQKRQPPAERKTELTGAPSRTLPPEHPMPRVVRSGPAS